LVATNPSSKGRRARHRRKRLHHTLVILGVGCFFTLVALLVQPFYSINLWLSGQLFTSQPPSPNIAIAGIDDNTLETYGRWADWPRGLHAQAIDNLSQAGAKVIGFDVIFTDSSPDDEMLATAMAKADNVVLAAVGTQPVSQARTEITYDNFLLPIASLEQAASNIGHANVVPDGDGTVSDSYATGTVIGNKWIISGGFGVGGLVGKNEDTVSNSYSTGSVTGDDYVGGLVGQNLYGVVSNSFWDTQTNGQGSSDGGTPKTTAEMMDFDTFDGAGWDITTVDDADDRNTDYIWNIVDDET
jgi:hypothetical protein